MRNTVKRYEVKTQINRLHAWAEHIEEEYMKIEREQENILRSMQAKGYTIKEINGHRYVYTWRYLGKQDGRDKYKWKCLGRADRINPELIRDQQVKILWEEYKKLEKKKEAILQTLQSALEIFQSLPEKLNCVVDGKDE